MQVVAQTPSELVVHDGRWNLVVMAAAFFTFGTGAMWLRWTHPTGWSGNGGPWLVYTVGTIFTISSFFIFWSAADRRYVVDRGTRTVTMIVQRLVRRETSIIQFNDIEDVVLEESPGVSSRAGGAPGAPTYRPAFLMKNGSHMPWMPYLSGDRKRQETCAAAVRAFGGWSAQHAQHAQDVQPVTAPPAMLAHPVATNWGCLAAFLSIFVAIGLGIFSIQIYRIATWRPVPAVVISSNVGVVHGSKGNSYKPVVVYNYRVNGYPFQAATVTPVDISASQGWAQGIASRYRPGSTTTAYVNPSNPYGAFLYRVPSLMPLLFVAFPVVFGLLYGWLLNRQRAQVALADKHLVPVVPASSIQLGGA